MKKYLLKLFILSALLSLVFVSCEKDSETNPSTSTSDRDKFLGTWITTSHGTQPSLSFSMTITAGTSSASQIKMENFDGEGTGTFVFADVSGSNAVIQQQVVNGDTIQGSGTYSSSGTLSFTYTFRDGQTVDNRTATAHK
jgi:hypothetical protein